MGDVESCCLLEGGIFIEFKVVAHGHVVYVCGLHWGMFENVVGHTMFSNI